MNEANNCRALSLTYPGVLEIWRKRLSSNSGIDDIPLVINQNILDTGFPAAVTYIVSTGRAEPRQECSELVTTFNLLYQPIENDFPNLNLFVHNTGEIYQNYGMVRHIRKFRSRETRTKQTKAILRWCAENEPQLMPLTGKTTCGLKLATNSVQSGTTLGFTSQTCTCLPIYCKES